MNELRQWGGHPVVHRLGWTLLHFLWQGAVTAGLFAVAYIRQRKCSSNMRYGTGCVALLLMLAAPVVTFVVLGPEQTMPVALTIQSNPQLNPARSPTFSQTRNVLTPGVQHGPAASLPVEISSIAPVAPAMNPEKFIRSLFRETSGKASQAQFYVFMDTWNWADAAQTYAEFVDDCPNSMREEAADAGLYTSKMWHEKVYPKIHCSPSKTCSTVRSAFKSPSQLNSFAKALREAKPEKQQEML